MTDCRDEIAAWNDAAEAATEPVRSPTPLTETEADVLCALVHLTERDGYQPSTSELIIETGRPGVHTVLTRLDRKGWIALSGRVRAIKISDEARAFARDRQQAQDAPENEG